MQRTARRLFLLAHAELAAPFGAIPCRALYAGLGKR
jgi:hypothetical protein